MISSKKKKLNWLELCPDVLRCVFGKLSFTDLNRAKLVCSSWYSASRGCVPRNQIPWLILFPEANNNNKTNSNKSSCVLFVPDDRDKVYKTRDLGFDFAQSCCLATYGSWLLMMDIDWNLNILNPLTGEKIDLPLTEYHKGSPPPPYAQPYHFDFDPEHEDLYPSLACLWIDHVSKDYLVAWRMVEKILVNKTGSNTWQEISRCFVSTWRREQLVYEHKTQKLYFHQDGSVVKSWCFSGDDDRPQLVSEDYPPIVYAYWDFLPDRSKDEDELYVKEYVDSRLNIVVSRVSGQVLKVACAVQKSKRWFFLVYRMHPIDLNWEVVDSLGDEALILDMGITVIAKDIPGIKSNSIYFSGLDYGRNNPDHIFVFDLNTHKIETLPLCVFSSIPFSDARWFFPGFSS
ncbi:unnamed protein product [Microthlaspi erraticum]|uniref:F-box domain-containing protein n=2 Tax=Microthlaspi erraticum TaxID=1685480 RepID=A0A6D2JFQ2_9BRAS|nr:unnamed protein product [Microthlaspi erraticum]